MTTKNESPDGEYFSSKVKWLYAVLFCLLLALVSASLGLTAVPNLALFVWFFVFPPLLLVSATTAVVTATIWMFGDSRKSFILTDFSVSFLFTVILIVIYAISFSFNSLVLHWLVVAIILSNILALFKKNSFEKTNETLGYSLLILLLCANSVIGCSIIMGESPFSLLILYDIDIR